MNPPAFEPPLARSVAAAAPRLARGTTVRGIRSARGAVVLVALALSAAACGPRRVGVVGPVEDPASRAAALERATRLERPVQLVFEWRASEGGIRGEGRGVARAQPPHHARLDLFLRNGETAMRAALVDGAFRLPPDAPDDMLPPPDLMWGALGVFHLHENARLLGGDRLEDGALRLRYGYDANLELHYEVVGERLRRVDLLDGGRIVQTVSLDPDPDGPRPLAATYRHLTELRELRITRESLTPAEPFPDEIWSPVGER